LASGDFGPLAVLNTKFDAKVISIMPQ